MSWKITSVTFLSSTQPMWYNIDPFLFTAVVVCLSADQTADGRTLPLSSRSNVTVLAQELPPAPARHKVPVRFVDKLFALSSTRASPLRALLLWINFCSFIGTSWQGNEESFWWTRLPPRP